MTELQRKRGRLNERIRPGLARKIRAGLYEREVSQAALAREAGISRAAINAVIRGKSSSKKVRDLICTVLGWKQWPEQEANP